MSRSVERERTPRGGGSHRGGMPKPAFGRRARTAMTPKTFIQTEISSSSGSGRRRMNPAPPMKAARPEVAVIRDLRPSLSIGVTVYRGMVTWIRGCFTDETRLVWCCPVVLRN